MSSNSTWVNDIVVNWALTATAAVLTIGRYVIRYFFSQKLYWDDLAHFAALATLIAHGVTNQITLNYKAEVAAVGKKAPPDQLLAMNEHLSYLNDVNNCLLYLVFWEVKVSFLLFYKHIFHTNRRFNIVWWVVLVVTLCLVWGPLGGVIATCAGQTTLAGYEYCNGATPARNVKLIYTCVINVVTDLAIMALPFWMLRELKVKRKQKLGLAFVFSLASFTVILDIVRTVEALSGNQDLYTILELNFNVIVSCLPSYRALLKMENRKSSRNKYKPSGSASYGASDVSSSNRKGSIPWPFQSRSRSEAGLGEQQHQQPRKGTGGFPGGIGQGDRKIELQSVAWKAQRHPSASAARVKDPYAIEPESRTSLVDPKDSAIVDTAAVDDAWRPSPQAMPILRDSERQFGSSVDSFHGQRQEALV